MEKALVESINSAQEIVEKSNVKSEFSRIAFEVTLKHLIGQSYGGPTHHISSEDIPLDKADQINYADFIDHKQPKNDYQIIACIVHFLTKGIVSESVTKDELVSFIHQNPGRIRRLNNLNDVIRHTRNTSSYKYIEAFKDENEYRYRLSAIGKQLIDSLPEQPERKKPRRQKRNRKTQG